MVVPCIKQKYSTRAYAKRGARRRNRLATHREPGKKLEAYKCEVCGFWHVGHGKKKTVRL
jgi:hypothetical protein